MAYNIQNQLVDEQEWNGLEPVLVFVFGVIDV